MKEQQMFEIAAGSVLGTNHKWDEKNNQDAFYYFQDDQCLIAIVCDGCSEGKHSEIGARIGSRIIANNIRLGLGYRYPGPTLLDSVQYQSVQDLHTLINLIGVDDMLHSQLVGDYFLFTVVGVVIYRGAALIFSLGDGVYALNGKVTCLGPFPNNAPPYLAYSGLVLSSLQSSYPALLRLQVRAALPSDKVDSILIGTDGLTSFIDSADAPMPGKTDKVGDLSQFWTDDRYFLNRDMVRRKLCLTNRSVAYPDWSAHRMVSEKGLLSDDTTLVVVRRKGGIV